MNPILITDSCHAENIDSDLFDAKALLPLCWQRQSGEINAGPLSQLPIPVSSEVSQPPRQ